VDQL